MMDSSIITGKATTGNPSASTALTKKLYIKIFPGEFTLKPPRPKKAKVLQGELLVRYSGREWPIKKNGPLVGDPGFLQSIINLLSDLDLANAQDISFAEIQQDIKETVTIRVGTALAQELLDRGYVSLDK